MLLLAKALREAARGPLAREGQPRGRPPRSARRSPRPRARELERPALPPPLDRPRLARSSSPTTSRSTPAPASSTPPPATAGTTTSPASATASTSTARSTRRGRFLPEVEHFAGQKVFDANPDDRRAPARDAAPCSQAGKDTHSYPLCWRCKNPIIFRATEQWFIALDEGKPTLREQALAAIAAVAAGCPAWGEERIHNMIATRPDWCISRQRLWGVPIPAFYCKGCGEILLRADLARHVADVFETETRRRLVRARGRRTCCPRASPARSAAARRSTRRPTSSTSGSTPAPRTPPCSGAGPTCRWPADVYLEGSDQHRGWFHSSLLIGVATRGRAPYRQVITHGFTVDGEGKKMSKSLGNDVDTQKLISTYGAEILRLWTIMVDYREDMRISDEMIKRVAEAYRKVRNTLPLPALEPLRLRPRPGRAWPRRRSTSSTATPSHRHRQVVARVLDAYDDLRVPPRLPPARPVLRGRPLVLLPRRAQGPALLRRRGGPAAALGPDRAPPDRPRPVPACWPPSSPSPPTRSGRYVPGPPGALGAPRALPRRARPPDDALLARWAGLLDVRAEVTKALEEARAAKQIAASLEAAVVLRGPGAALAPLRAPRGEERASSPATSPTSSS